MPREIKFRAWDAENHEMLYQGSNSCENNGVMDCQINFDILGHSVWCTVYGDQDYIEKKGTELMQYTGLKDKNGKEIYEGDLIPYHFNENKVGVVKYGEYKNIGDDAHASHIGFYVEWDEELRKYLRKDLGYWIKVSAVKNNIYENPELLEG